jgi:peptidoglycan/LPS O-acetylase OafA/YrhL
MSSHNHHKFLVLDGIRGVAALFVMQRHTFSSWGFLPFRSYLAVDIFFLLSGFVIAHAYDHLLVNGRMSAMEFLRVRLIRLYPMYAVSVVVCSAILVYKLTGHDGAYAGQYVGAILTIVFAACFAPFHAAGNPYLYPLNPPGWSLFFELLTNVGYALTRTFCGSRALLTLVTLEYLVLAVLAAHHGDLDTGTEWETISIAIGLCRSLFGITLGVLLYLHRATLIRVLSLRGAYALPILATGLVLVIPSIKGLDWIVDLVILATVFPVCVLAGAEAAVPHSRVLGLLGAVSYPIYVLHLPASHVFSRVLFGLDGRYRPLGGVVFGVLMIGLAWWAERHVELPMRRWLTARFRQPKPRDGTALATEGTGA